MKLLSSQETRRRVMRVAFRVFIGTVILVVSAAVAQASVTKVLEPQLQQNAGCGKKPPPGGSE
jgi:uncharacterized membrane protein